MNLKVILVSMLVLGALGPVQAQDEEPAAEVDAAPETRPVKKPKKPAKAANSAKAARAGAAPAARRAISPPALPDEDVASFPAPTPGRRRAAPVAPRRAPVAAPEGEEEAGPVTANRHGLLRVVVPRERRVRAVTMYLEETGERAVVEDQAHPTPNSIVNVGRGSTTEIGFDGAKVKDKRAIEDLAAVFYVFSGVIKLKEMEITPAFLRKGNELLDTGETPQVFRLEVLELDRIGDTEGRVVKTIDPISFRIGEVNPIPLNVDIASGKKVGVRISIPEESAPRESIFLQLKAAKKGKFPVNVVSTKGRTSAKQVVYSPQVRFSFVPNASDVDTFANPTESLIGQINRYVERHAKAGDTAITVPLRVKVEYR